MKTEGLNPQEVIRILDQEVHQNFDQNQNLLSFDEYLGLIQKNPKRQLRASAQYLVDLFEQKNFKLFEAFPDQDIRAVIGQEKAQDRIYRALKTFSRQGANNKLLLLHGPNGSAKSSIAQALMGGMEKYSKTQEGALYTFSWIFPVERYTRSNIGLQTTSTHKASTAETYAKLPDEEIAARLPSEMKDHPLLLIQLTYITTLIQKLNKIPKILLSTTIITKLIPITFLHNLHHIT
jgi:predicted Ser/Thr protein kinase